MATTIIYVGVGVGAFIAGATAITLAAIVRAAYAAHRTRRLDIDHRFMAAREITSRAARGAGPLRWE